LGPTSGTANSASLPSLRTSTLDTVGEVGGGGRPAERHSEGGTLPTYVCVEPMNVGVELTIIGMGQANVDVGLTSAGVGLKNVVVGLNNCWLGTGQMLVFNCIYAQLKYSIFGVLN
jgi:hypothetical protein